MARRILDTAFWDDTDVAELGYPERLLLICMITDESLSNDYGWLPAHPKLLKKHAFGYDECTVSEVETWRNAIFEKCKNVKLYTVNGQEYIDLVKFSEWQKIRYKRKTHLPPPPRLDEETVTALQNEREEIVSADREAGHKYRATEKGRATRRRKDARRRSPNSAASATLTEAEWQKALDWFGNVCAYCGISKLPLEQDHIIPVGEGGAYEAENILPACKRCNISKSNNALEDWVVGPARAFVLKNAIARIDDYLLSIAESFRDVAESSHKQREVPERIATGRVGLGSDGQGRVGLGSDGLKDQEPAAPDTDSDKALVRQALELRGRSEGEVVTGGEHLQMLQWGKEYGAQVLLKACQVTFDACPDNFGGYLRKTLEQLGKPRVPVIRREVLG